MSGPDRAAMRALMRGVATLMRFESWRMLGKFDGLDGPREMWKWARVLKDEATALFEEARRI